MSATAILLSALLTQSAFSMGADSNAGESADVGFEQLATGEPQAAIDAIEANRNLASDDPAALINLGNAYAQLGQMDKAIHCYRAAIASDTRYELELADGRWVDSRQAARMALNALMNNKTYAQALRD